MTPTAISDKVLLLIAILAAWMMPNFDAERSAVPTLLETPTIKGGVLGRARLRRAVTGFRGTKSGFDGVSPYRERCYLPHLFGEFSNFRLLENLPNRLLHLLGLRSRLFALGNWASHHDVVGPVQKKCFFRRDCSLLVVPHGQIREGPDARCDDEETGRPASRATWRLPSRRK